jgi:hypothetical protein
MYIHNIPLYVYELKRCSLSTLYPNQIYDFMYIMLGTNTHLLSVTACGTSAIIGTSEKINVAANMFFLQCQKLAYVAMDTQIQRWSKRNKFVVVSSRHMP